ncbi:MAG: ComEC/Rec2 family competence protein [Corynebacterium sp.]|nr:ComEC/Rec2 family competence protein [Corynebacterium sp.]
MRELRLVPAALTVWLCVLLPWWGVIPAPGAVVVAGAFLLASKPAMAALSGMSGFLVWLRVYLQSTYVPDGTVLAQILSAPRQTKTGRWIATVEIDEHRFTVLSKDPLGTNDLYRMDVSLIEDASGTLLRASNVSLVEQRTTWSEAVKDIFLEAVVRFGGGEGLIPGMVVGDTRLQSPSDQTVYTLTGLSHLSAVSGSNVAIVLATVAIVAAKLNHHLRLGLCALALLGFVFLVGPEPSVLRAGVMGAVGLVAVLFHSRMEPIHALSLAVILLLFVDPELGRHYGFALSVAATAGIIGLYPAFLPAFSRLPAIVARALAVTIAADIVTQPIIAMMSGRISFVSVSCNMLAAPLVPVVTVLGMLACILSLIPGNFEALPLLICRCCAWWIDLVANTAFSLPMANVELGMGFISIFWATMLALWVHAILWGITRKKKAGPEGPAIDKGLVNKQD